MKREVTLNQINEYKIVFLQLDYIGGKSIFYWAVNSQPLSVFRLIKQTYARIITTSSTHA